MWLPASIYVALKGLKLKLFFLRLTSIKVENYLLNILFIHKLQNMQLTLATGTLLCNNS